MLKIIGMYCPEHDITFVVREESLADGTLTRREVTGMYHGEPDDASNEYFDGEDSMEYDY